MSAAEYDAAAINAATNLVELVGRYRELKQQGQEYVGLCVAHDDKTPSMTVAPEKGFVHCFSCEFHQDAIGFLQHVESIPYLEACKRLTNGGGAVTQIAKSPPKRELKKSPTRKTFAPPAATSPPKMTIKSIGEPTGVWIYRDAAGEPIGYATRYDGEKGKEFRFWSWGQRSPSDVPGWACGHFEAPRHLYGLDRLAENPDWQVLICEGEKTADAAQRLFPSMVAIAWPAGANAHKYADWTPLVGRKIVLIPDNDEAGRKAMRGLAKTLWEVGATQIKVITTGVHPLGGNAPEGWDLGDEPNLTHDEALKWARENVLPLEAPLKPDAATDAMTEAIERDLSDSAGIEATHIPADSKSLAVDAPREPTRAELHGLAVTKDGAPLMNLDNVIRIIETDEDIRGKLWYDEFPDAIITNWQGKLRQWTDSDDLLLQLYMQRHAGLTRVSSITCHDAAMIAACRNPKNECRDWIKSLVWDGTPRLAHLLSDGFGAAHDEYSQAVGRCWITSIVARVLEPGCKVDTVPVLEGEQGIGKSTGLAILGGKWFIESHESVMSKDFFGVLDGHMLVEISEMHSFTRAEVERIKGVISCQVDRYRKAYGRNTQDHPRHTVLVCTTNRDDWQRDETGARRFWPVHCGAVSLEWLRTNRDNLFAEAHHLYATTHVWWDVPDDLQRRETDSRREIDSWETAIKLWLVGKAKTTAGEVLADCLHLDLNQHDIMIQRRVGRILRMLGWVNRNHRGADGKQGKFWVSPEFRKTMGG